MINFEVKKLSHTATIPSYGSDYAIGLDLYADIPETILLYSGERIVVSTGIACAIPLGYYGRVAPRSGLSVNKGFDVLGGVIDSDYRGEIKVILINHDVGGKMHTIHNGERIAQLILEKADRAKIFIVDELSSTNRGSSGFGSTGA